MNLEKAIEQIKRIQAIQPELCVSMDDIFLLLLQEVRDLKSRVEHLEISVENNRNCV